MATRQADRSLPKWNPGGPSRRHELDRARFDFDQPTRQVDVADARCLASQPLRHVARSSMVPELIQIDQLIEPTHRRKAQCAERPFPGLHVVMPGEAHLDRSTPGIHRDTQQLSIMKFKLSDVHGAA